MASQGENVWPFNVMPRTCRELGTRDYGGGATLFGGLRCKNEQG